MSGKRILKLFAGIICWGSIGTTDLQESSIFSCIAFSFNHLDTREIAKLDACLIGQMGLDTPTGPTDIANDDAMNLANGIKGAATLRRPILMIFFHKFAVVAFHDWLLDFRRRAHLTKVMALLLCWCLFSLHSAS